MSELIQMRQRIKAIETIKKVTHAMRLISMSMHTRLRTKQTALKEYKDTLGSLVNTLQKELPNWQHPRLQPSPESEGSSLVIIIGSQKGLCGSFNTNLLKFVTPALTKYQNPIELILVGKKIIEAFNKSSYKIILDRSSLTVTNAGNIAQVITEHIMRNPHAYSTVDVYYNFPRSFFSQKPKQFRIIPWETTETTKQETLEYYWEQPPEELLTILIETLIQSTIQELCLQSLIAEHAARFIAMDSSTSNASSLLDTMKLQYNKVRQAKITRELTDLMSGL